MAPMAIHIKNDDEIEKMRIAGRLAADVLDMITPYVKVGATTEELNQRCHDYVTNEQKAYPATLRYSLLSLLLVCGVWALSQNSS